MNNNKDIDQETNYREEIPKFNDIDITGTNLYSIYETSRKKLKKSLFFFKDSTNKIIIKDILPLISDIKNNNKSDNEQIIYIVKRISKWWVTYLNIVEEVYEKKNNKINWKSESNEEKWFSETDCKSLKETLDALEKHQDYNHWKNLLLQTCCRMSQSLLKDFEYKNKKIESFTNDVLNYFLIQIKCELNNLEKKCKNQSNYNSKFLTKFRLKMLNELESILEMCLSNPKENEPHILTILSGKFNKTDLKNNLSHSVIIGDDGGFYTLLNRASDDELLMLNEEDISEDYLKNITINSIKNITINSKIIIGKGSFGKIKISVALTTNKTSDILKDGQIICVKETIHLKNNMNYNSKNNMMKNKEIRKNTWNNYHTREISKLINSPDI